MLLENITSPTRCAIIWIAPEYYTKNCEYVLDRPDVVGVRAVRCTMAGLFLRSSLRRHLCVSAVLRLGHFAPALAQLAPLIYRQHTPQLDAHLCEHPRGVGTRGG
jgi:hypothetical protein